MNAKLEEQVWARAGGWCEYCWMPQAFDEMPFEIDHVVSRKHGGATVLGNLALSCFWCNRHKGSDLSSFDPKTRKKIGLYHPRRHKWDRHFRWDGARLIGRTPVGRATVFLLRMNHPLAIRVRLELIREGVFPPVR